MGGAIVDLYCSWETNPNHQFRESANHYLVFEDFQILFSVPPSSIRIHGSCLWPSNSFQALDIAKEHGKRTHIELLQPSSDGLQSEALDLGIPAPSVPEPLLLAAPLPPPAGAPGPGGHTPGGALVAAPLGGARVTRAAEELQVQHLMGEAKANG